MFQPAFQTAGLQRFRLFESTDVDDTRERISGVMQQHALVPLEACRASRSRMDFARLGQVGLGTIAFGTGMRVEVGAVDGYYLLMFCVAGHAVVGSGAQAVRADREHAILCAPGQRFDAKLSPDCEQLVLRVEPEAFAAHTGFDASTLPAGLDLTRAAWQPWLQQLQLIAGSPALLECAQHSERVAAELERLLVTLLACGLDYEPRMHGRAASGSARVAPAFVRRAEEYIDTYAGDALRLSDIATAVGLSNRTLLDGFAKFRGTSPMQYLRQVRLCRARQTLRAAEPGARVADIAFDCGFTHLGRFSRAYLEAFGETPSDTLRRSR